MGLVKRSFSVEAWMTSRLTNTTLSEYNVPGELVLWLGWVFFFGSFSVLVAFLLLAVLLNFRVVPREERELEARFGDAYIQYKKRVRRWFGVSRSRIQDEMT